MSSVEGTYDGLDVHAHAVVRAALDGESGELLRRRLGSNPGEVLAWVRSLPGPVAAAYEAGPTGFTLVRVASGWRALRGARALEAAATGRRTRQDPARDALDVAKLLKLDEIVAVTIPSESEEAARDLVRARERARALKAASPGPATPTRAPAADCAAWHHRTHYTPTSPSLRERRAPATAVARTTATCDSTGAGDRSKRAAIKGQVIANAALARELAGWCWSLAVMES